jgi:DNA repair protein RadA/Sms
VTKKGALWRCQDCGATSPRWLGRCGDCGQFNTFVEENTQPKANPAGGWVFLSEEPQTLSDIVAPEVDRRLTGIAEFDRMLGGGIVPGSLTLLGGEPGVGKSTLLMQVAGKMAARGEKVLIVSGEESPEQLRLRAARLNLKSDNLLILAEISVEAIRTAVESTRPDLLIVDSIQTLYHSEIASAPGTVSQVRECTGHLVRLGKSSGLPVFIIGHVTKEGAIAGPRLLEHMVDTVLYFEGGGHNAYRLVRSVKNRFGPANELAVFEMSELGLSEVANPSAFFLTDRPRDVAGSIAAATIEGTRTFLVEVQALAAPSYLTMPRRLTTGMDFNRAMLTLAVLEKRAGVKLNQADIYLNVAGGVKVSEPALDLPLALALVSASSERPIAQDTCAFGEIGLGGEIRSVTHAENRIKEAAKLGFKRIIMPDQKISKTPKGVELLTAGDLRSAIRYLTGT